MKTLLLHRCQWFTNHTVTMQLGRNFGISPAKTIWIMDIALPVMIAAMAKTAAYASGTSSLYAAIMSPKVDVHIDQNLSRIFDEPNAVENAVRIGCDRATSFLDAKLPRLAEVVAEITGATVEAVTAIVGMMTVLLFGLVKCHLHASQGQQHALVGLLKAQMASVRPLITPRCWDAIGYGDVDTFHQNIDAQLEHTLASFPQVMPCAVTFDSTRMNLDDIKGGHTTSAGDRSSIYKKLMRFLTPR